MMRNSVHEQLERSRAVERRSEVIPQGPLWAALSLAPFLLAGCLFEHVRQWGNVDHAIATVTPASGSNVTGTVTFLQLQEGVKVIAELEGLEPGSTHAMHIHEYGDCSASDATSAGGHYNPDEQLHGLPPGERHAGDLGNVTADEDGRVQHEITVENLSVAELDNPVIGRAVIVHAKRDTGEQPTGEAGTRIGCGVIGAANPDSAGG